MGSEEDDSINELTSTFDQSQINMMCDDCEQPTHHYGQSQNQLASPCKLSSIDVYNWLNCDKSVVFVEHKNQPFCRSHSKSFSEGCLNYLKHNSKHMKRFDKTVEMVEHKIRMYVSRGDINRRLSKIITSTTQSTNPLNSDKNIRRKRSNPLISNKPSNIGMDMDMDTTEKNKNYPKGNFLKKTHLTFKPKKFAIQIQPNPWCVLYKNFPNCSNFFVKSLQKFTTIADQYYNHTTTDPTERFFIQQLKLVASNALHLAINVDSNDSSKAPTISIGTLDNFVNEIRQIYLNQSKMNLKYVLLNRLLIKILKIFEYGIRIMESLEISPLAYSKAFDRMKFFETNTKQHMEWPRLFKCFNKVPSINSLLVLLRRKQKQIVNRSSSSTAAVTTTTLSRLPPSTVRKTSVPHAIDSINSIYSESGLSFDLTFSSATTHNAVKNNISANGGDIEANKDNDLPTITHRIDDFTIIKLISQGASATVYLVNCNRTFEHYALKMIGKRSILIKNQVKNVFVERDVLSVTKSPFIVELYASFETATHVCLLTEYVYGGDCAAILRKRKPFTIELIRHISAQLILAIEYIHKMGIVHRDIKPANVLLCHDGTVKLTDFGLCTVTLPKHSNKINKKCAIEKIDDECSLVGTPDYFAPEIIKKVPYGKSVDWWCLGLFIYEASFTEPPFFGETIEELFHEILHGNIPWPTDVFSVANETKDLIEHLLEKEPDDRWGDHNIDAIKEHSLFKDCVDWANVHINKIPTLQLSNIWDTRHYDCRSEFYDHDADFMSDLSLEEFSKVSENEVFHNYQYSSPSFSNKIRLSASLNPFSDESRDSSSIKNILESSIDSEKYASRSLPHKLKFNPNHRSSFLGTVYEQPQSPTHSLDGKSRVPQIQTSSSIYSAFPNNFSSPKQTHFDSHSKNVIVTLKRDDECHGGWPGFVVGCKPITNNNDSSGYYIKELTTAFQLAYPFILTNSIISHVDDICTTTMDLTELQSRIANATDHLVLTLVPFYNSQDNYWLSQSLPTDIETDVSQKSLSLSANSSSKDKYVVVADSQLTSPMDLDAATSSIMNSTFNSDYEFHYHRSQRKNSNLEPDIDNSIQMMSVSPKWDVTRRFSSTINTQSHYKNYDSYSAIESSLGDNIRNSSHDLSHMDESDTVLSDDNTKNSTN